MAVCGIKCVDLTTETIKSLGKHFSYNQVINTKKWGKHHEYTKYFKIM